MRVMVTGGTGFTGSRLVQRLIDDGDEVRALVRPGSTQAHLEHERVEVIEGQLTDADDVRRAAEGCEVIYHIAAMFRAANQPDRVYHDVNVEGTRHVLDAAAERGVRVVHCSTGGVHGHIHEPPADEDAPFNPGDIYQVTKLEGEKLVMSRKDSQPVTVVRPGPIYGETDMRFLKLYKMIRTGRFRMIGTGTPRLHLTHVDDLVDGIVRAGRRDEALGEVFILAGPYSPQLNEIAAEIAKLCGVSLKSGRIPVWPVFMAGALCEMVCIPLRVQPPIYRRRVAFFTHHREFDIAKARRLLGYDPQVSWQEGLARVARWYVAQGHLEPPADGADDPMADPTGQASREIA